MKIVADRLIEADVDKTNINRAMKSIHVILTKSAENMNIVGNFPDTSLHLRI